LAVTQSEEGILFVCPDAPVGCTLTAWGIKNSSGVRTTCTAYCHYECRNGCKRLNPVQLDGICIFLKQDGPYI
jgi:hypothetical protein